MKAAMTGVIGVILGAAGGYFGATQLAPSGGASSFGNYALETDSDILAYASLYNGVEGMMQDDPEASPEAFRKGLDDILTGRDSEVTDLQFRDAISRFTAAQQEKRQAERQKEVDENSAAGEAFLNEKRAEEGVVFTESGLGYKVITEGEGESPTPADRVTVHYTGTLIDGTVFDSSVERGRPATFGVTQVIGGWVEGLQLMKPGSKFEFYIPSDLAYGDGGSGDSIPPASTLVFEVELISIAE